uniref:EGF-like domain-containing protein n=1 Tax=Caenorhabditis japonica TaxID=281687 RepID=A0A8R1E0L7_CAEJA
MNKILLVSFLFFTTISQVSGSSKEDKFDPDDCYEPGTLFEDDERNLGFCPCRYGYYGPTCFEIHDCVIGEIRTENCSRDFKDDFDLQWRCVESGRDAVKICTCPEGFRGETCEYILENTLATWLVSVKQSQKFFDVIYNETDSVVRLFATFLWRKEEGNLRNEEKVNSELPLCENVAPPPYEKLEILTVNSQEHEEVSIVFKPNIHV